MRWTELPIWRIGWFERAFYLTARRFIFQPKTLFDNLLFGFDISYYQQAVNFQKMKNYGAKFLIPRCGYAAVKDLRFDEYMIMSEGLLPVSVYHYYDPLVNPVQQANKVLETLQPYKSRIRRVYGDFEFYWSGAYQAPGHWKTYRDIIKGAGYKWGWYTRATWWDSRVGTFAAEFATDPVWAAQYNNSLTLIPHGWTKAHLWQKGTPSIGIAAGVSSQEIDYNLWNTDFSFVEEWNITPPPPETITQPYEGMTQYVGVKNGWRYFLQVIDPHKFTYEIYSSQARETVSNVARRMGADVATNAGEWNRETGEPTNYPFAPRLILMQDGSIRIDHVDIPEQAEHLTGLRYLIRAGVMMAYLDGSEPQYTEGHSRTIEGLTVDGRHIQMVSEGQYPNQGLTLRQAAEVMASHGAVVAFDSGGGGDSTLYMNGQVLNVPEDVSGGVHVERAIPEILLLYAREVNMTRYTATAIGNDTRLRPDHNTGNTALASYPARTVFYGDVLWTATANLTNAAGVRYQQVGDVWLQVITPRAGWVAVSNMGTPITTLVDNGTTPPATDSIEVKVTKDGVTKTYKIDGDVVES